MKKNIERMLRRNEWTILLTEPNFAKGITADILEKKDLIARTVFNFVNQAFPILSLNLNRKNFPHCAKAVHSSLLL